MVMHQTWHCTAGSTLYKIFEYQAWLGLVVRVFACFCCYMLAAVATPRYSCLQVAVSDAMVILQVGGFLSFNLLFPSERPDIPRLMG